MDPMEWILVGLSLAGNYYVVKKDRRGYMLWIIANIGWVIFAVYFRHYGQAVMFSAYLVFAVWGFRSWGIKPIA